MKQTRNPYLPGWEYIPDGEPKFLAIGFMYMVRMMRQRVSDIAQEIMCVGVLQQTI